MMKEYKKITMGERGGVIVAEVMAGKGDSIFVDKIRHYTDLTPSTITRITNLAKDTDHHYLGLTSWGVSITRRL